MQSSVIVLDAVDHERIVTRVWRPDAEPRAAVQIAHGMTEHSGRYERFATELTTRGYVVYANDHRGHGRTAEFDDRLGHFADRNGWELAVGDLPTVTDRIGEDYPGLPVVLFGHSMGSSLSRDYASRHADRLAGLILMGLLPIRRIPAVARPIIEARRALRGTHKPDKLLNRLVFGGFNKPFAPSRTDFDWLSRDEAEVDAYIADPWCGTTPTTTFFRDLLVGLQRISSDAATASVPRDLPVLVLAGAADPVAAQGNAVYDVTRQFARAGVADVTGRIYQGARHELLNELNRPQVTADILAWLDARLG